MTTESQELPQHEPETKRNLVAEFVKASGFGPPPEVCRQMEKPSPENEQNIVNQVIETSGFGLAKRS